VKQGATSRFPVGFAEKFYARCVERDLGGAHGPCMEWTGSRTKAGYGQLSCKAVSKMPMLAHRVSWEIASGSPPARHVLHKCDNPACVRYAHLFEGDQKDNNRDRDQKGRVASGDRNGSRTKRCRNPFVKNRGSGLTGEAHPQARLSDQDIAAIRREYLGKHGDLARLGRRYAVSSTHILRIVRCESRVSSKET